MQRGDLVPEFELPDQDGKPTTLGDLVADGPLVLFFYPMAMTAGCTKESCHFRDLADDFKQVGARRVWISTDPVEKQRRFADLHDFGYLLLSDVDGTVARIFGVKRRFGPLPVKRTTFVIDTGRRVLDVIASEVHMDKHADEALAVLRRRYRTGTLWSSIQLTS